MSEYIDIVFDGPPSHESGRFVEVENDQGRSIKFGVWVERDDGFWALRILRSGLDAERERQKDERIAELEARERDVSDQLRKERDRMIQFLDAISVSASSWIIFNAYMDEREAFAKIDKEQNDE